MKRKLILCVIYFIYAFVKIIILFIFVCKRFCSPWHLFQSEFDLGLGSLQCTAVSRINLARKINRCMVTFREIDLLALAF